MTLAFRKLLAPVLFIVLAVHGTGARAAGALFTIGYTVAGLTPNSGLVIRNGSDVIAVSAAGSAVFPTALPNGASYNVTVAQVPGNPVQYCTVTGGTGIVNNANVTAPRITCAVRYGRFAYTTSFFDSVIALYGISAAGQWQHRGYLPDFNNPASIAMHPSQQWLYVATQPTNGAQTITNGIIDAYQIDGSTGDLREFGGAEAPLDPYLVQIDSQGRFLFLANSTLVASASAPQGFVSQDGLTSYSINPRSGELTNAGSVPLSSDIGKLGKVAVDPSGHFLYGIFLGNFEFHGEPTNSVAVWSINQSSGALTALPPFTLPANTIPMDIQFDPAGKSVYIVTNGTFSGSVPSSVLTCQVDPSTGALNIVSTFSAFKPFTAVPGFISVQMLPGAIAIDPATEFAYVLSRSNTASLTPEPYANQVTAFSIDSGAGALTPIGVSAIQSTVSASSVSVDPSGNFLDVASDGEVSTFPINRSTGALVGSLDASGFLAHSSSTAMVGFAGVSGFAMQRSSSPAAPAARYAYVTNIQSNSISSYSINPTTGVPTPLANITTAAPPGHIATNQQGTVAYVTSTDNSGTIAEYFISPTDGSLSLVGTASGQAAPSALVVDPSGRFAYTASGTQILGFNGVTPAVQLNTPDTTGFISSLAIDPEGQFLYATNQAAQTITVLEINPANGNLFNLERQAPFAVSTAERPFALAFAPGGRFAYTVDSTTSPSSMITRYISALREFDTLAEAGIPVATGTLVAQSIALDPSGRFAYALSLTNQQISVFAVDANTGALTLQGEVPTGATSLSMSIDPSGKYLYLLNQSNNTLLTYKINPTTGALTAVTSVATGGLPFGVITVGTVP